MSGQGAEITNVWQDREFAEAWVRSDRSGEILELPRRLAAALVAQESPGSSLVIDIGSGPGSFLEAFLDELPSARGIWSDTSEAMADEAHRRLGRFGGRVEYRTVDMTDLAAADLPTGAGAIITSRAAHHLDRAELAGFYRHTAGLLAPGGWLVNLDHVGPADVWDRRLRALRPRFVPPGGEGPKHHHNYPLASAAYHLDAYRQAGVDDVEIVWRAFYTCLFMGRTPGGS